MTKNKKVGISLAVLGLIIGGVSTIAFQSRAQVQTGTVTPTVINTSQGDIQTPLDTDNIQDKDGIEKPDIQDKQSVKANDKTENEANDTDGGANEDAN